MHVHLTRPAVVAAANATRTDDGWDVDLPLDDVQSDGRACIRCGQRGGRMVPVGWAERPEDVLCRLGVSEDARVCQVFSHEECAPPTVSS